MKRPVAIAVLLMLAVFGYSVVGALTYRLHEARFPGTGPEWEVNPSGAVGVFWPIGLPASLAIYVVDQLPEVIP